MEICAHLHVSRRGSLDRDLSFVGTDSGGRRIGSGLSATCPTIGDELIGTSNFLDQDFGRRDASVLSHPASTTSFLSPRSGSQLAVIKHADDNARVRHALESLMRLADGENLRGAETADAFELPQVSKFVWKRSTHTF